MARTVLAGLVRLARLAAVAPLVLVAGACGATSGPDAVPASTLTVHEVTTPPGPAYLSQSLGQNRPSWEAVVAGQSVSLGTITDADWLADGQLLVQRATYQRSGPDLGVTGTSAQLVDPTTGEVLREVPGTFLGDWGVTPEAITLRGDQRLVVYSPDLGERRVIEVGADAVSTDQLGGSEAEFSIHHTAYTLDGVSWVQWGVNSEDDTRTDHGVLRIEDGEPQEVLRNQPVVSLVPSSDGAALLVLMQDNGEDEDCGGCVVEQKVVELDPATGEVAADYGMPDDYDRGWGVEAIDKVGEQVAVRFAIGEAETSDDPGVTRQTWVYDGEWTHLEELDGTRTRWQDGGALAWTQLQTRRDEGEGAAFRLTWTPEGGSEEVVVNGPADCPRNDGTVAAPIGSVVCPLLSAPGSLLPPD